MIHPLLAQVAPEVKNLVLGGEAAAGLIFIKGIFDLYSNFMERQERKRNSQEFIEQTMHLRQMSGDISIMKDNQLKDTQSISTGIKNQDMMLVKIDRIDRGVRDLKLMAGIPDSETIITKKSDVKS